MLSMSQDHTIQSLKQELIKCYSEIKWYESQLKNTEKQIASLEEENWTLQRFNKHLSDKVTELECRVDPYSFDGTPVCNSQF